MRNRIIETGDRPMTQPTRRSPRELRAIAFQLADEIETKAQPLIKGGMSREAAINKVLEEMAA
jgi:hypothetical protein